ncbi:protein serine threonine phosphatase 2C [Mycena amicta]|nr:protein serine threonine phosphatase 2C [Mycena amicta]
MAEQTRNAFGQLYTSLDEAQLATELSRLSLAQSPSEDTDIRSQDRYCVADWPLSNGVWRFRATFDGHAGHETADYAVATVDPPTITNILRDTIASVDAKIGQEFLALFPGGPQAVESLSEEEIVAIINDDGVNNTKTLRCMRELDVWVASLGDCPSRYLERIRSEHPGEPECVLRDRVIGALAVTRGSLPTVYTSNVFMKSQPGFRFSSNIAEFIGRNISPPYVSAQCDVQHVSVAYGLDHREPEVCSKKWVEVLGRPERSGNRALYLLRDAMGQDADKVSSLLTVESEQRWMDDTTVIFTSLL